MEFGVPSNIVKGGVYSSGMYDLKAMLISKRSSFVKFTDEMEDAMSSQRHLDLLRAPITVAFGTNETPEVRGAFTDARP
jgi:arylformamidase